jgi:predicted Zn finger-like uncharacterized protein
VTTTNCPGCGAALRMSEDLAGRVVRCPRCQHEFTVAEAAPVAEVVAADQADAPAPLPSRSFNEDRFEPRRRPKRKSKTCLLTCGILTAVFLVLCGGGGTLIYFVFIREIEEPLTAADRDLPITAERLQDFLPTLRVDPSLGKLRKVRHLDGSRELEYEYEPPEGAASVLYVTHSIGVEGSAEDARYAYGGLRIGTNIGVNLEDKVRQVERNDLWRWGDESRCVVLYNGNAKVGNIFMARKGKRYFQLVISGIYFDDAESIRQLLQPFLDKLDSYSG